MTSRVVDHNGHEWVTADQAAADLHVRPGLIWLWAHRYHLDRHRAQGRTWYRLDQLRTAETTSNKRLTRQSAKRP